MVCTPIPPIIGQTYQVLPATATVKEG